MFDGIFEAIEEWMRELFDGDGHVNDNHVYRCQ